MVDAADQETVDLVVLSPHLDDAVYSCGGALAQGTFGERVLVATLFAGDPPDEEERTWTPFARRVYHYMDLDPASGVTARRDEDEEACDILGARPRHFDLREAIFRPDEEDGSPYDSYASLFGSPAPEDEVAQLDALARCLEQLPPAPRWLVPLAIGGHVDHRLVRTAAETLVLGWSGRAAPPELAYYEDYPYARKLGSRLRVLGPPWRRVWRSRRVPLSADALRRKIGAVAAYRSQVAPLFGDEETLERKIAAFARRRGGERFWSPAGARPRTRA